MEIPVCLLEDSSNVMEETNLYKHPDKLNLLLVGAMDYPPNIEAFEFMQKKVMPFLEDVCLNVVGKNSEMLKNRYENLSNIEIVGEVKSLDPYYIYADAVIIPLFSGGGMKVKTAEALKFGKNILGTKEAFEGYEVDYSKVGALCETVEDFLMAIRTLKKGNYYNQYCRNYFEANHSFEVMKKKFSSLFQES